MHITIAVAVDIDDFVNPCHSVNRGHRLQGCLPNHTCTAIFMYVCMHTTICVHVHLPHASSLTNFIYLCVFVWINWTPIGFLAILLVMLQRCALTTPNRVNLKTQYSTDLSYVSTHVAIYIYVKSTCWVITTISVLRSAQAHAKSQTWTIPYELTKLSFIPKQVNSPPQPLPQRWSQWHSNVEWVTVIYLNCWYSVGCS